MTSRAMTSRCTAVIVTHNSSVHIGACLAALRDTGVAVRVVDNASTDGTPALIAREHPEVELVASADNLGFARAVNRGTAGLTTPYILLVNPDCVVPGPTVDGLLAHLDADGSTGIVGPALTNVDGSVAVSAHPFESLASVVLSRFGGSLIPVSVRRRFSGARRRQAYDACRGGGAAVAVDWLAGACLAVRTSLLHDVGGLDERYFLYYEDEELCLQAARRGRRVVLLPALRALHVGGASSAQVGATWPHLYRSMLVFFYRHRRSTYQAVRLAVFLRALLGIGLGLVRLGLRRDCGPARARAWWLVARIAVGARPESDRTEEAAA